MKTTLYASLAVMAVLCAACRDEDRVRMPKLQEGVNMRIVMDAAKRDFTAANLGGSAVEFDAYSINQNLSKVDFVGDYVDASAEDTLRGKLVLSLSASSFSNGKARGVLTAAQVATAFGLAGGTAGMGAGDELTLSPVVTLTDGRVFSAANSSPSITSGNNPSFTVLFGATVK